MCAISMKVNMNVRESVVWGIVLLSCHVCRPHYVLAVVV